MRWILLDRVRKTHPDIPVEENCPKGAGAFQSEAH